jgi:hypothetical protein
MAEFILTRYEAGEHLVLDLMNWNNIKNTIRSTLESVIDFLDIIHCPVFLHNENSSRDRD